MLTVRPSTFSDLVSIEKLANHNSAKISTLPQQRDKLSAKIDASTRSFAGDESMGGIEQFLFILENTETGEVLGTAGIDRSAGNGQPFYNYRRDELIHSSRQLQVNNHIPILYMTHELTGKTLFCSLTIAPEYRGTEFFGLLSRARLLFIGLFKERFDEDIIIEIQGVSDETGDCPFWDSLGRHFFDMDFATADHYSGVKSKTFIAELMPSHPIYVPLLSDAAQAAIGKPHPLAEQNCQLLHREGFRVGNHIDIFDGGPTLGAHVNDLNTVKSMHTKTVKVTESNGGGVKYLICNGDFSDFKCVVGHLTDGIGDVIRINHTLAKVLDVSEKERVTFAPL
ncbi:arginine/ornithine succinyltransferase subunit alpha [Alkalimarinus alittae]|uniref:Arginine/ornithine succinyltransferase subunit alpha n=1 Tax=Alkalimarinus alittae TaxID=2961619 RepID=A0ABY6N4G7_9ALTE|nr:arginine/ornithine succinyltransferase subunit alpha [Alkalimarinus alittae]UZE97011.1 arginine/ornithine succinyltransferase subunit alpha [Alkalimarinus alittae]